LQDEELSLVSQPLLDQEESDWVEGIAQTAADLDTYWATGAAQRLPPVEQEFEAPPRFADLTPIGYGGMGVVYSAFDKQNKEAVAIKVGKAEWGDSDLIKREFRTLVEIRHPNLVVLKELHQFGGNVFFSMEHVRGDCFNAESVTQKKADVPWQPDQLADVCERLLELASGIDFLHRNGYAHCDIKPSNILVTPSGRVVVLDLGLARSFDSHRNRYDQRLGGTSAYMAPEQAGGELPQAASDWFSFGVVMFETLFGFRPFQGYELDILFDKLAGNAVAPSFVESGVGQSLGRLCLDLLKPDPSQRPGVEEIRRCLEQFSKSPTASAQPRSTQTGFIARRKQLRQLNRRLVDSRDSGQPALVFVEAASGMGKTYLIQKFLEDCRNESESIILSGRCYENERIPYKAIDAVIAEIAVQWRLHDQAGAVSAELIQAISSVFKEFSNAAGSQEKVSSTDYSAAEGLRAVLKELSSGGRHIIVFIDDVQWADADSGELLGEMIRDVPLLLVCAHRPIQWTNPFLSHLREEFADPLQGGRAVQRVKVGPLSDQDAQQLLDRNFPNLNQQVLRKAIEASDGVPMYLNSLAEQLRWMPAGEIESNTLDWARELGPQEKRLLQFICASGYPLPQSIALEAAEITHDVEASVSDLSARGLVTLGQSDGQLVLTPFHDMIRESIYAALDTDQQKQVHSSIAHVSEEKTGVAPDRLAFHFRAAGDRVKCCHYSILAGDAAAKSQAFSEAARAFQDALEHFVGSDKEKLVLKQKLASSLGQLGRSSEAGDLYFELASQEDIGHQFLQQAAYQYCAAGRIDDALQGFERLLKPLGYNIFESDTSVLWRLVWLRLKITVSDKRDWLKNWIPWGSRKSRVTTEADASGACDALIKAPMEISTSSDNKLCDVLWETGIALSFFDTMQGCLFSHYSQQVAIRGGDESRILRANIWRACQEAMFGASKEKLVKRLLDASDTPTTHRIPYLAGLHLISQAMADHCFGNWDGAHEKFTAAEEILATNFDDTTFFESGNGYHLDQMGIGVAQLHGLFSLQYAGRFKAVAERYHRLLASPTNRDHILNKSNLMIFVGPYVSLCSDEPTQACSCIDEALKMWPVDKLSHQQIIAQYVRTEVLLYQRKYRLAAVTMEKLWETASRSNYFHFENMRILVRELRARCAVGQLGTANNRSAEKVLSRAIKAIEREKVAWAQPMAQKIRGMMELKKQNFKAAEVALSAAHEGFKQCQMEHYQHTSAAKLCEITGQRDTRLTQEVRDWFVHQEIKNQEAFIEMHYPRWSD
jgi:serine/threonine protein kinase/tetratricopeptide (TPR) repeat protein